MENDVTEEPEAIIALSQFSHGQKEFEAYRTSTTDNSTGYAWHKTKRVNLFFLIAGLL
jgi:hypothetical protein